MHVNFNIWLRAYIRSSPKGSQLQVKGFAFLGQAIKVQWGGPQIPVAGEWRFSSLTNPVSCF